MRQRGRCAVLICLQLLIGFIVASEEVTNQQNAAGAAGTGKAGAECLDCGYTPDAPAPLSGGSIPRCSDVLCLVQGLLDKKSLIYVEHDIDISGSAPLPDVTSEVTIMGTCSQGAPCKIDAKGSSRIFIVGLNGYLTLKDLEITGASCGRGSAVTVSGSGSNDSRKGGKFVALNVKFTHNVATELGGALNVESGGTAYVRDCIFRSNKAVKGGAVFVGSSKEFPAHGESYSDSYVSCALNGCSTFVDTEFTFNSADIGGAVYVDDAARDCKESGGAKFDCTTCAFRDNSAQKDGGAVFVNYQSAGAIAYFRKARFIKNTAGGYGGDISTQEGEYGARGAQLYAYQVDFSGSSASKGSAVAVKPFSFSTFARCDFNSQSSLQCQGSCDTFCPSASPLSNGSVPYGPSGESCPVPPAPLCSWVPAECEGLPPSSPPSLSPPPPAPASPPPSPSPPPPSPTPPSPPPSASPPPPSPSPSSSPPPPSPPPPSLRKPLNPSPSPPRHSLPPSNPPPSPPAPISPPPEESLSPAPTPSQSAAAPRRAVSSRHRNGSITGDPHFVGKHGERFDFHGKGDHDYCIVSDKDVHFNMHVFKGLHKRSTFISKIGLLFKEDRILIEAQANKLALRFEDQWKILVNDAELPRGQMKETLSGLIIMHSDRLVQLRVKGEMDVIVKVMPPSFGRYGSGANYLDFQISQLKVSPSVHGVLGQTYQESSRTYEKIHEAKRRRAKRSRAAAFYMDGSESDYVSSGIMTADCKFSAYMDQSQVSTRIQRMMLEGMKTFLGINKQDEEVVLGCTGFGHFLCSAESDD